MAVFQVDLQSGRCHHGADKGFCHNSSCRNFSGVAQDDIKFFFGRQSSGAAAQKLFSKYHDDKCTPETPCKYHALQAQAKADNLIF